MGKRRHNCKNARNGLFLLLLFEIDISIIYAMMTWVLPSEEIEDYLDGSIFVSSLNKPR